MREHTVTLGSGRTVRVREEGSSQGPAIFSLHGTPGCRYLPPRAAKDAESRGIRLIGYDRPGYGDSPPRPGRTVADTASDVAEIADALGVGRFGVWGHSGGGAPSLAVAALLPNRVVAAAALAGGAPVHAAGLNWTEGMGALNVEDVELFFRDRTAWLEKTRQDREELLRFTPEELLRAWSSLISEVDRGQLDPATVQFLYEDIREAVRPGIDGMVDDTISELSDWGFDLSRIRIPVQVWHGRHDRFVPFAHGEWMAKHIPGVDAHLEPNEGHLSLLNRVPEVHAWMLTKF